MGKYDDIINRERPVSQKHPKMSLHDRAAQFAPFAALTGHRESIAETERLTSERILLDENEKAELDYSLQYLLQLGRGTPFRMVCFEKDLYKAGGRYITVNGNFKKADMEKKMIFTEDGRRFRLEDIFNLEIL